MSELLSCNHCKRIATRDHVHPEGRISLRIDVLGTGEVLHACSWQCLERLARAMQGDREPQAQLRDRDRDLSGV